MKRSGIYCLTSPSDKSYVGQSIDIDKRLGVYKSAHCKGQQKIYHAIAKYGFDAFKVTILEECERCALNEREIFWIKELGTVESGYNLRVGGSGGGFYTVEARQRMSDACKGRRLSAESKKKMSLAKLGRKTPEPTKIKMRDAYRNLPKETRTSMMDLRRSRNPKWGIQPSTPGKFKVMFDFNHETHYKGKFTSYEEARNWRDEKLSTLQS